MASFDMTPLTSADSPSTLTGVEAPASDPVISFPELLIVEEKLRESFQRADSTIKDSCLQLLSSGGKRLRPLLTLQSAQCFGTLNLAIIDAAVAAELIHMASLIHDDVIDFSELRRGVQTINAQQGNQIAVLAGDYVFAEAFRILANKHLHTCMSYLVDAIQAMCDGEVQQASDHFNLTVDSSQYFTRIAQKTGILLSSCCACGAASAGASQTDIDSMGLYGMNLGYAYQIIDDILDFTGNPYVTGKPVAADLSNGNITLPMIYLLEKPLYGPWAAEILQKKELSPRDSERILQALISSEALDEAFSAALHCAQAAVASLNSLPASSAKTFLIKLTQTILYRKA